MSCLWLRYLYKFIIIQRIWRGQKREVFTYEDIARLSRHFFIETGWSWQLAVSMVTPLQKQLAADQTPLLLANDFFLWSGISHASAASGLKSESLFAVSIRKLKASNKLALSLSPPLARRKSVTGIWPATTNSWPWKTPCWTFSAMPLKSSFKSTNSGPTMPFLLMSPINLCK